MEAYVIKAKNSVYNATQNMLCRVQLHLLKSLVKVYPALDCAGLGSSVGYMMNDSGLLIGVTHTRRAYISSIGTLPALLGKERSPIKHHVITAVAGRDG